MYVGSLFPLYGKILYLPRPWEKLAFEDGLIRLVERKPLGMRELFNPAAMNPRFWREVRDLSFRFQEGDRAAVAAFYQQYGEFGCPADPSGGAERWDEVAAALDWFRSLTLLVEWVKQQKMGPLRELYWSARKESKNGDPSDDNIRLAAWWAAVEAAQNFMQTIPIIPGMQNVQEVSPAATFSFFARAALPAAFAQWFFQELASVNVTPCGAEGCRNPVLPPRRKFCSETCRQREKKRRQRRPKYRREGV